MGEPAHVLPFPKGGKPKSQRRPQQVVLRFPVSDDDTCGGLFPEGFKASQSALYGMQRDRDYAKDTHMGGAFDAVLQRAQEQLRQTQAVLESLVNRGLRLRVEEGTLWVKGPAGWANDDEVARVVREYRDRLVAYLGG